MARKWSNLNLATIGQAFVHSIIREMNPWLWIMSGGGPMILRSCQRR